jgi:hypothetical protein
MVLRSTAHQTLRRHQLEVTSMFKKILLSAAALSGLVLFASQADAGYGYGYGGYGYKHYRHHYSYCHYVKRPVTIRVWDDYSYSYFYKTIYRSYKVC